jgi:hypothetical protein
VEPDNAKLTEFLGLFTKEEVVAITIGLSPAESGCFKQWGVVFVQQDRRMALTGKDGPDRSDQQVILGALWSALTWEHPCEKTPGPRTWAPISFIYRMRITDIMDSIKTGRRHTLEVELEHTGAEIAALCDTRAQNIALKLYNCGAALSGFSLP